MAGAIQVLAHYPAWLVESIVDPFNGLPSKYTFFPSIKDLKDECEKLMEPAIRAEEGKRMMAAQFADRKLLEAPLDNRPTYEELQVQCAAVGIFIGKRKPPPRDVCIAEFKKKFGLTDEEFDKIPDATPPK